jgi:hypothetical protein
MDVQPNQAEFRSDPDRGKTTAAGGAGWSGSVFLGLFLAVVYLINERTIGPDDTMTASLLPFYILRGEGIYLENRRPGDVGLSGPIPHFMAISRGHLMTLYPIAPALVALPLVAPQVAVLDFVRPGWDEDRVRAYKECFRMVKRSMAVLVALAGVILHRLLLFFKLRRVAVPAILAGFLGSDLWIVGSQAAWQHGPAALVLVMAIALLHPQPVSRRRLVLAGLATALLVACRLMDAIFAAAIVAWLFWTDRRRLGWFLPAPIVGGLALLGYNVWYFGHILGGHPRLESVHPILHGVTGSWSGDLWGGLLGTLLSPNRGLFIFSPWIAVALATLAVPSVRRRLAPYSLISTLLVSLVPYLFILSKYSVWWGGHCFGPRYWTDAVPVFTILLAFGLDWMLTRSRVLIVMSTVTIVWSIAVQSIGAFCYPSTWNIRPTNVDRHHERLWDWRDTELSRCLFESYKPPEW